MIKKNKIPTLLGLIVLVAGIFAGVFFVGMKQIFRIGADSSVTPKNVRVTNITGDSATVSWITDKQTAGFVIWGSSKNSINKVEKEAPVNQKYFSHSVTLNGLEPKSTYFFKINSDGNVFDNNNLAWELTTGAALDVNKGTQLISGSVLTTSGNPAKRALVYANIGGYVLSTLTSETGNFVFQLSLVRTIDLGKYASINPSETLVEISVEAEGGAVGSAQIFPQSANPVPPIILGQVYDFRGLEPPVAGQVPNANLSLPPDAEKISKFSLPVTPSAPSPTSVILESLEEGEVITSTKPAFFGRGPGGQTITITVESDPVTETFKIATNGTWTWSPPQDLSPGTHSVTVSWIDSLGITRIITKNFIIQAGEAPAFEATPSQTIAPTPKASESGSPATTPTPTISATATPTAQPLPETGALTPTLILSILGLGIFSLSFVIYKYAQTQ